MKNQFSILIAVTLYVVLGFSGLVHADRATVAIPDFENKAGAPANIGPGLSTMMTTALENINKFQIVERSKLNAIANEQLLGASGIIDPEKSAQVGKITGADYLLLGTITRAELVANNTAISIIKIGKITLHLGMDISFVDTETGAVKYATHVEKSESKSGWSVSDIQVDTSSPAFESVAREVVNGLAIEIALAVFPSKVMRTNPDNGEITFSYGIGFFEVGDSIRVIDTSNSFVDPDTGEAILNKVEVGVIQVTKVEKNYTVGLLSSGSATEGTLCEKIHDISKDTSKKSTSKKKKRFGKRNR
ncbi:MAG: hypothetical protein JKY53_13420 [Flavobacteriales bacterium]|nr:hypothetical protein [Flavobacteriales bacterium]